MSPDSEPVEPRDRLVQIDVRLILPARRLVWLLTGVAVGNLHLPNGLLEKASFVLRTLLSG